LELAGTQEAKVAALTKLLKHLQMIEDQLKALQETGLETKGGVMHATAARLKAEIELERLKAGQ
jgi:hypothetical protein